MNQYLNVIFSFYVEFLSFLRNNCFKMDWRNNSAGEIVRNLFRRSKYKLVPK